MPWPPSFLVIEDDPMYRTLYVRSVHRLFPEARIVQACDGAEAKQRLAADQFDLVVMDLHMPVLDGAKLLAEVKQDPDHRDLVFMVVSAFDVLARAVQLAAHPNVFSFPKPLRADEFQLILLQCLRLSAQLRLHEAPPPEAPHKAPPDIVDRGHLALYVGKDIELQNAITEQFALLAPNLVERLQRNIWADNYSLAAELAQDIHAATTMVGAHLAAKLAHRLHLCAQDKDRGICNALCQQLAEAVEAYVKALTAPAQKMHQHLH